MKKVISLLLSLVVILSCFSAVYADGFNYVFDETDISLPKTDGHNVSVGKKLENKDRNRRQNGS